jgi:DNA-binding transcriptional MerR regulator
VQFFITAASLRVEVHFMSRTLRIGIIQLARSAGFSIAETRTFVTNYPSGSIPSARWQAVADRKVQEMDALIEKAALQMVGSVRRF